MNADQLLTFAAVAEHLNISHAATALHLSQPAVSGQLRQLQDEFGESLYRRHGRGVQLTAVGEQLAHYAVQLRDVYGQVRAYRDAVRGLEQGRLRIGASTTTASYVLPYLIAEFQARVPGVLIQTMSGNTADVINALSSLDVAMIEGPPSMALPFGTNAHAWREDEIVAIVSPTHPFAKRTPEKGRHGRRRLLLAELSGQPLVLREAGSGVRQLVERILTEAGMPMHVALEIASVEGVKEAVRAGMGVGFVSAMSLRNDDTALVMLSFAPLPLTRHFSILVPHGDAPSRVTARFLDLVMTYVWP